ncbi:MAG: LysR family transcriptional regulator [bacterium]|nr:LysR family transcriptional regulator [bacterium]
MELRVLQYFLAVAREQSISAAAEYLHLSQPTLSRQIRDMEKELGKQLFVRGNRKIILTEEGMILRKRAEEILELVHKTENEIAQSDDTVAGDIYIGTGESEGVRLLIKAGMAIQQEYPNIHIHMVSGDSMDLKDQLDKGLFDFAVLWDPTDISAYESLCLPHKDCIGILMPADCSLAKKEQIMISDLTDLPLICSRQQLKNDILSNFLAEGGYRQNIVATYNLLFNASLMVQEGIGYAIGFNKIIDTTGDRNLVWKPLYPSTELRMNLVWKKYQMFTKASQLFLQKIQILLEEGLSK